MIVFSTLVISILSASWFYVWVSVFAPLELTGLIYYTTVIIFVLSFCLQIVRWIYRSFFEIHESLLWITYFFLGFVCHLFFGGMIKDVIVFLSSVFHLPFFVTVKSLQIASATTLVVCFAANLWGIKSALSGPIVKTLDVTLNGFGNLPLKIVQISDLHVGPMIRAAQLKKIVDMVQKLNPDLIVCTGDMIDDLPSEVAHELEPLKELSAPLGKYVVTGNHEYYFHVHEWLPEFAKIGLIHLYNEGR